VTFAYWSIRRRRSASSGRSDCFINLCGRPKAWEFGKEHPLQEKQEYRRLQEETILATIRQYNPDIPVEHNMDFGHSNPQICMPYGGSVRLNSAGKSIAIRF